MEGKNSCVHLNLWRKRQPIYTGVRGSLAGMLAEHEPPLCLKSNNYKQQYDFYERQRTALASLRAYIQPTISRNCLYYAFECETAREMLVELQKRFKPTDH